MPAHSTERVEAPSPVDRFAWLGWLPLAILLPIAVSVRKLTPAWGFMWLLAFSIYSALKWLTWWRARNVRHSPWRSVAYLLAWPGMDAPSFLDSGQHAQPPRPHDWLSATAKTAIGAALLWIVARRIPEGLPLLRGWIGMLGLVLLLHFGSFHLLSLFWQSIGVDARPIMSAPLRAKSLAEFWGRRWNLGFSQLAHELVFRPLHRSWGANATGFLVFVVSGLIHDAVISLPASAGYGMPTLYFVLQGTGVLLERSAVGKRLGLRHGVRG